MIYRSSFLKGTDYFHLTVHFGDQSKMQVSLEQLWRELPIALRDIPYLDVQACVLMSNHLHVLVAVDQGYTQFLNNSVLVAIRKATGLALSLVEIGLTQIHSFAQYREAYRYIYRNPIEAQIVPSAEQYLYSTLSELLGLREKVFFVNDKMGLITNPFPILSWINLNRNQISH